MHFLELGSDGSHLFLQFADAVSVGSLGSDEGILHAFEVVGHLQYKLVVGVDKRDHIGPSSVIIRGPIGVRAFLRCAGRLRCVQGGKTPDRHIEAELVQGHSRSSASTQLR
jgi:hypothetical protein